MSSPLRLGSATFAPDELVVMAIINRTPDSFFDRGATYHDEAAEDAAARAVADGARILDVGGVKAGPGEEVDEAEEIRRTASFVAVLRAAYPDVAISIDTWRASVGRVACQEGADLLNDAWGGYEPELAAVAAEFGVGLVCTHTGGAAPRTRPHRVEYDDVVADIRTRTVGEIERALALGVRADRLVLDPGHDFGKNTYHSLEATRRLPEIVATGWPVLVSLSRKDFIGETLDIADPGERLTGTLAATAISAWQGARIFRAHDVAQTRQTLDMVATIEGTLPPVRVRRGLV